jgi:outer membrane protein OmpA-like peptidoglycan-associated protein
MTKFWCIILLFCQIGYTESISALRKPSTYEISYSKILQYANKFLGRSYGYGQKNNQKVDCSGFVQEVFSHFGILIPRSVFEQSHLGILIDFQNLREGDLLFFYRDHKISPSHVAIYAGNGKIIHASYNAKCVHFDSIDKAFYREHFLFAKRLTIVNTDSLIPFNICAVSNAEGTLSDTSKHMKSAKKNTISVQSKSDITEVEIVSDKVVSTNQSLALIKSKDEIKLVQDIEQYSTLLTLPQHKFRNYQIFDGRDITISQEGKEYLHKWAQLFRAGGYKSVVINVYTDNIPPKLMKVRFSTNIILSEARAKMIADYLIIQGIDSNKIKANGMGDVNPVASNVTEEEQSKNRRIEFIF